MTKTILITGGTGVVGSQLVKHFFNKKYNVVFLAKEKTEIKNFIVKNNIKNKKNNLKGFSIDLSKSNAITKLLKTLETAKIYPTHLINCARSLNYLKVDSNGITRRPEWLGEFTLDVIVPYELSVNIANQKHSKLKSIINISSMYGIVPFNPALYNNPSTDAPIQYSVSKAAQIHLTKELAVRLSPIKVNAVSFGGIKGRVDEDFKKRYSNLCPLKKMLKKEEVINAVDFLINSSDISITGHNLVVDGGWSIW